MDREVIVSTAFHSFGLTLYGQHIYWTDFFTKKIYRANKYDGSDLIAMTTTLPMRPKGISTVTKNVQQQCSNPCDQFNGGCSHICVPGKTSPLKMKASNTITSNKVVL
jgi:low density lipoprotein-related protein 2